MKKITFQEVADNLFQLNYALRQIVELRHTVRALRLQGVIVTKECVYKSLFQNLLRVFDTWYFGNDTRSACHIFCAHYAQKLAS